jgi:hypothetical protein
MNRESGFHLGGITIEYLVMLTILVLPPQR